MSKRRKRRKLREEIKAILLTILIGGISIVLGVEIALIILGK